MGAWLLFVRGRASCAQDSGCGLGSTGTWWSDTGVWMTSTCSSPRSIDPELLPLLPPCDQHHLLNSIGRTQEEGHQLPLEPRLPEIPPRRRFGHVEDLDGRCFHRVACICSVAGELRSSGGYKARASMVMGLGVRKGMSNLFVFSK